MTELAPPTKTADYLYAIQTGEPASNVLVRAHSTVDAIWTGFLDLCFNPLHQYGRYGRAAEMPFLEGEDDVEDVNHALQHDWYAWKECLHAVETGAALDTTLVQFTGSGAWPVFARIVRKKCPEIHESLATKYGSWRPWGIGFPGHYCDTVYPAYLEPILSGDRRIVIIRRGHLGKVDVFDVNGTLMPEPSDVFESMADLRLHVSGDWFRDGLVLDGIFHPIIVDAGLQDAYTVFDALPLMKFASGDQHGTYEERRKLVETIACRSHELSIPLFSIPSAACSTPADIPTRRATIIASCKYPESIQGWVVKPANSGYPYGHSDDWVIV